LKGTGIGVGAALSAYGSLFGIPVSFAQEMTATADDDTQTIINLAATAELFATTHYAAAIKSSRLGLDPTQVNYLKAAFIAEQDHLDLLKSLGAVPVVTQFYVPDGLFDDKMMFANTTEVAEDTFIAAYLAATRIFAAAGATPFAVTTAQIAGVESEHKSFVRQMAGKLPNNVSYEKFLFPNVSGAVPTLQPFLDGQAEGFVGPVMPPTDDEIAAIRGEAETLGYDSTSLPYAAM
jgi:hypothetical protein